MSALNTILWAGYITLGLWLCLHKYIAYSSTQAVNKSTIEKYKDL